MLFVSSIEPINHYTKRVTVSNENGVVGVITFGEYVTDSQIRMRAPLFFMDKKQPKQSKKELQEQQLYERLFKN